MARTALIAKLAAIGDVVMALPMVSAIRESAPQTRITWLCGRQVAPLLAKVEGIDEVIAIDEAAILGGGRVAKARAVAEAWARLTARDFDTVYVAHSDARYRLLVKPVRCGELRWLGERAGRPGLIAGRSHSDEYVRLVTGCDDYRAVRYAPPTVAATLDPTLEARLPASAGPWVALAPGGARNLARDNPLRRWPLERYAQLADRAIADGASVLLTGGETDGWVRQAFSALPVIDLVGSTDLPGLVALYRCCAAVVTHDSGPLHLARLAGTQVVALFGPTPPSAFVPDDARTRILWPGAALPCAPCYDGREFARCDDNLCMQQIGVAQAYAELRALLASAPR